MDFEIYWNIIHDSIIPFYVAGNSVDKKSPKFSEYFQSEVKVLHSDITVLLHFMLICLKLLAFSSYFSFWTPMIHIG